MSSSALLGTHEVDLDGGLTTSLQSNTLFNSSSNPLAYNPSQPSLQNTRRASSFASANDNSLSTNIVSSGKFGDFDGRNDFQLTIEINGNQETFSLTGNGYGEVFKDINNNYEYVSFTGTDASTTVQISAINNIKFGDYLGSKLNVQTDGSITAGNITLQNTKASSSPGLVLRSGLSDVQGSASGSGYRITDLGVLPGGSDSFAYDINNSGQVVGYSDDSAFLYSNGRMTDLGNLLGGSYSSAYGINDRGQVVGQFHGSDDQYYGFLYSDGKMIVFDRTWSANGINDSGTVVGDPGSSAEQNYAFLYSNGLMTDLGTLPGGNNSFAKGINDRSQVVGASNNHAFLYSNGSMIDLGTLPGDYSFSSVAYDINNSGQVIGYSYGSGGVHAFLYSDGQMTDLGTLPGGGFSRAYGINDRGQIVGYSDGNFGGNSWLHAFLESNGTMTDLNSLIPSESGWILETARAINDFGQIVGNGFINGQQHAFLLDPISTPTPSITVGNISTQGDSIQLQSSKITLTGSSIITKGGNITLDGPTILNSSTGALAINSTKSTANSRGGNITFSNTVDGQSAGTQNLNLTAGQGNITFNNAVGSNASLLDVIVNTAKIFTASEGITSRGNTTINATQNITTGDVTSNNGAVKLTSLQSTIATGNITTGGNATSGSSGNATDITLKAASNITTASLSTHSAGKVSITLKQNTAVANQNSGNVTTGSINAKLVDLLSDGGFTAHSDIETNNGDVNITTIRNIVTQKITATNGAVELISGSGSITADGEINSDKGLAALAQQDITTSRIQSSQEAIILSSSQGAVTVNGEITSNGDVSIDALGNVVSQAITSLDGAVALISHRGAVTASGSILSAEKIFLAAQKNVLAQQDIRSQFDVVALVSSSGSVTASGEIVGGTDVAIFAKQNIITQNILSLWSGTVALVTSQGIVATQRGVTTNNDDVYIISVQGNVFKHYVNGAAVGISARNDTILSFVPKPLPIDPRALWPIIIEELLKELLRVEPAGSPRHADEINPITGKPYHDKKEYELVKQLTPEQQKALKGIIKNQTTLQRITGEEVRTKGKVDTEHGCFSMEVLGHLGDEKFPPAADYATWVTGSPNDFLVIDRQGISAFYDGIVNQRGAASSIVGRIMGDPSQPIVAEAKLGYEWLNKFIKPKNQLPSGFSRDPNLVNGSTAPNEREQRIFNQMKEEIEREAEVARHCGLRFFVSFNRFQAWASGLELFSAPGIREIKEFVMVFYIRAQGQRNP